MRSSHSEPHEMTGGMQSMSMQRSGSISFNNTDVPEVVGVPCCAQFAVARWQVWKHPLGDYQHYHKWLMETELEDDISGRVMEYMWHIIFGQNPV
jgi:hypothetical protein